METLLVSVPVVWICVCSRSFHNTLSFSCRNCISKRCVKWSVLPIASLDLLITIVLFYDYLQTRSVLRAIPMQWNRCPLLALPLLLHSLTTSSSAYCWNSFKAKHSAQQEAEMLYLYMCLLHRPLLRSPLLRLSLQPRSM